MEINRTRFVKLSEIVDGTAVNARTIATAVAESAPPGAHCLVNAADVIQSLDRIIGIDAGSMDLLLCRLNRMSEEVLVDILN